MVPLAGSSSGLQDKAAHSAGVSDAVEYLLDSPRVSIMCLVRPAWVRMVLFPSRSTIQQYNLQLYLCGGAWYLQWPCLWWSCKYRHYWGAPTWFLGFYARFGQKWVGRWVGGGGRGNQYPWEIAGVTVGLIHCVGTSYVWCIFAFTFPPEQDATTPHHST